MNLRKAFVCLSWTFFSFVHAKSRDTLPLLNETEIPQTHAEMWRGFDPREEPLETEILKEWEQDEVVLQVLRFRIGRFKGKKSMMAGVYGYPKGAKGLPGLLQIHGGGQYADYKAPLTNAKRGYATLSIAWAGRISALQYRVSPHEVKLFWEGKVKDPKYKLTTDWGALDAYHAPSRYGKDAFPSIPVAEWTIDAVESPRNNSWFLVALAARRGLTFLERQPQVDGEKLGVYGHSMGGKLTVMTAGSDSRVKAAAPSCGGISDRYSSNPLHLATVSDPPSLKKISCPIAFLSPSNDFHGRINDLETAITEISTKEWQISCSPHHNHQDTPEYEVLTQLWFDRHLKNRFSFPQTPKVKLTLAKGKIPKVTLDIDEDKMEEVDIFYTQQGQVDGNKDNSTNTKNRFWHHAKARKIKGHWVAQLPVFSSDSPLWVYGNVSYKLPTPVSGAGYYYGEYNADRFVLSTLMQTVSPSQMKGSQTLASMKSQPMIEDFRGHWQKEWFTYKPEKWGISTHKIYHPVWKAPRNAKLSFEVFTDQPNRFVVSIDSYATEIAIERGGRFAKVDLDCKAFINAEGQALQGWNGIKELRLGEADILRPGRGSDAEPKKLGGSWKGKAPKFRNLRWVNN
jgi:hypothetical protein